LRHLPTTCAGMRGRHPNALGSSLAPPSRVVRGMRGRHPNALGSSLAPPSRVVRGMRGRHANALGSSLAPPSRVVRGMRGRHPNALGRDAMRSAVWHAAPTTIVYGVSAVNPAAKDGAAPPALAPAADGQHHSAMVPRSPRCPKTTSRIWSRAQPEDPPPGRPVRGGRTAFKDPALG